MGNFEGSGGSIIYRGDHNDRIGDVVKKSVLYANEKNVDVSFSFLNQIVFVKPGDTEGEVAFKFLTKHGLAEFALKKGGGKDCWLKTVAKQFDSSYAQISLFFAADLAHAVEASPEKPNTDLVIESFKKLLPSKHWPRSSISDGLNILKDVWKYGNLLTEPVVEGILKIMA